MTSLLVWFASDNKREAGFLPSSVYVASDSRVTWGSRTQKWDSGKKVFVSTQYPEVFAYCGDTLFAALILGQVVGAIDSGYLFSPGDSAELKMSKVTQLIRTAWESYPTEHKNDLHIVHVSRDGDGVSCKFWLQEHAFRKSSKTGLQTHKAKSAPSGEPSAALLVRGSGASAVQDNLDSWNQLYSDRHTSRATFSAFCESLRIGIDRKTGGPPQIGGLYRIRSGQSFGVIWNNARYFEGLKTITVAEKDAVEWRNDTFERMDQGKKKRKAGAAQHTRTQDVDSR